MFERFTPEARATVVLAQEQARGLGHNYIGTEHVLLGLLAAPGSPAASTLAAVGVDAPAVRAALLAAAGRGESHPTCHIPFTPRAKKVLELSLREALALRHRHIGAEHILLGLVREGEGLAAEVLAGQGADLAALRQEVATRLPAPTGRPGWRPSWRRPAASMAAMTPGAAQVAERATVRAAGAPVASHHYLLGLLDDDQSLAARALAELGVTRDAVEAKVAELGTAGTSDHTAVSWGALNTSLEAEGDMLTVRLEEPALAARVRDLYARLQVEVLRGPMLPGSERLWQAVVGAAGESVRAIEGFTRAPGEWARPGWAEADAATYAVTSRPEGLVPRFWLAPGVDPAAVRAFLAGWLLAALGPALAATGPAAELSVAVSRAGEGFAVTGWSCSPSPPGEAGAEGRYSAADLLAAALDDLGPPSTP
ncbi:MAG: Clp protease N-terminal domain-containing protein [Actinomycetota bacterium]